MIECEKFNKVIKGLECCIGYGIEDTPGCEDCPYNDMGDTCEHIRPLYEDTLALLKAQEPRVMSPEEVRALNFDDVIYIECYPTKDIFSAIVIAVRPKLLDIPIGVVQFRRGAGYNGIFNAELGCYGKTWRCWTSRPTDEQREAMPWN